MVPCVVAIDFAFCLGWAVSLDCDTSATKHATTPTTDDRRSQNEHNRSHNRSPMAGGGADPTGTMAGSDDGSTDPLTMVAAASGVATLVLASGLAYVLSRRSSKG